MHEGGKTEEVNVTLFLFNYIAICLIPQEILANFSIFVNYDKLLCKFAYVNFVHRRNERPFSRALILSKNVLFFLDITWIMAVLQVETVITSKRQFKQRLVREECLCQTIRV